MRQKRSSFLSSKGSLDLLVSLELAQRVCRPDRCGDPSDERDLKEQAEQTGEGAADREKVQPGQEDGENKAHVGLQKKGTEYSKRI